MTSSSISGTGLSMVVPLPPNMANRRWGHWAAKHKDKRAYWDSLTLRKESRIIPRPPLHWPAKAKVDITLYLWARMDRDNAYSRVKWLLDWLAGHGYIAGDREDQIDLVVTQQVDRRNQRIQVCITPLVGEGEEAS